MNRKVGEVAVTHIPSHFGVSLALIFIGLSLGIESVRSAAQSPSAPQTKVIGRGAVIDMDWDASSQVLAVATERGGWLYGSDLSDIAFLPVDEMPIPDSVEYAIRPVAIKQAAPEVWLMANARQQSVTLWDGTSGIATTHVTLQEYPTTATNEPTFSPNGQRIALLWGNVLYVWDSATGHLLQRLPTDAYYGLAWHPNGEQLATVDDTAQVIQIWDVTLSDQIATIDTTWLGMSVGQIHWSLDGRLIAGGVGLTDVVVWDVASKEAIAMLRDQGRTAAWSPDSQQLAVAKEDGSIRIWDVTDQKVLQVLREHTSLVTQMLWTASLFVSFSEDDGVLKTWDSTSFQRIRTRYEHTGAAVQSLAWSPTHNYLVSTDTEEMVRVWDVETGDVLAVMPPPDALTEIYVLDFPPEMQPDALIEAGQLVQSVVTKQVLPILNGRCVLWWSPTADFFVITGDDVIQTLKHRILAWDMVTMSMFNLIPLDTSDAIVLDVAVDTAQQQVAMSTLTGHVALLHLQTGAMEQLDTEATRAARAGYPYLPLAWNATGTILAGAGGGATVWLWASSGETLATYPIRSAAGGGYISDIAWSSAGDELALAVTAPYVPTIELLDTSSGEIRTLHHPDDTAKPFRAIAWNGDGTALAAGRQDGIIRIWQVAPYILDGAVGSTRPEQIGNQCAYFDRHKQGKG